MAGTSLVRRTTAVVAATALLSATGLASGALVGVANAATMAATSVSPNAVSNASTAVTAFTINGFGFGHGSPVVGADVSVMLVPTVAGDEVASIMATVDHTTSTDTALKVTAPLTMVAPEPYDVVVTQSGPTGGMSTCGHCLTVTNPGKATVTGVAKDTGDGFMTISGTNFAIGAKVSFLKPDLSVDTAMTFVSGRPASGITAFATGYPSTTTLKGHYTATLAAAAAGRHLLRVTNLDGQASCVTQTAPCPSSTPLVEFWQPKYTSTGPLTLGQGATNIPVTITGDGIRTGSTFALSQFPSTPSDKIDITIGTATVSADHLSITAPVSVGTNGGASARTVTVTGPDGGFVSHASLSVTALPDPSGGLDVTSFGQGATAVPAIITGTGFQPGIAFDVSGGGVHITTLTSPAVTATTAHVTVSVDPDATVSGRDTLTATNPDHGVGTLVGDGTPFVSPFPMTIDAAPLLTGISPSATTAGATSQSITLTGTGFDTNGMTVTFGAGITTNSVIVPNATTAFATITVAGDATPGPRDVVLTNTGSVASPGDQGRSTCVQCFGIDSLGVSPNAGANTNNALDLTFTAVASDLTGATGAVLHKRGSPAYQPDIVGTSFAGTGTTRTATFDLTSAAPGAYNAVITVPSGTVSCTGCFTITAPDFTLAPTPVTPATGGQGATDFPITVHGTGFSRGESITIPGTTVSQSSYVNSTTLTATITIPAGTPVGAVNVTVSSSDGGFSHTTSTTPYAIVAAPTVTSASTTSPDHKKIGQGATNRSVTIVGTGFTAASRVSFSGADVTATTAFVDATHLTATVAVAATAAIGLRNVIVTNTDNGGTSPATPPVTITVTAKPLPSQVSPASLAPGNSVPMTISGQGFQSDSVPVISGVTFSGTTVSSDGTGITTINTTATLASNAPAGTRAVTVFNSDGGTGSCAACFKVVPPPLILGGNVQRPLYGSTFVIRGTAPASTVVVLHFHKRGTAANDYSLVRSATANSSGSWTRAILANTDYRYYATDGSATSNNVLFQPRPTVSGPLTRVVAKNHTTSISGTSVPGTTVYVHFHKAGTAAGDYSIVRAVTANSSGAWTKSFLASVDYRIFASRAAGDSVSGYTTYVFQAR